MDRRLPFFSVLLVASAFVALSPSLSSAEEFIPVSVAGTVEKLTFEQHVRPILKTHCFQCHGEGEKHEGKLDLRLRRLIVHGGESGPALTEKDPTQSLMLRRIRAGEMPPDGKVLSQKETDLIERWIAGGALTKQEEPADLSHFGDVTDDEKSFWSFQPVRHPPIPPVNQIPVSTAPIPNEGSPDQAGIKSTSHANAQVPIDAFIFEALIAKGLDASPKAERNTFIRRSTFDLIGFPPTATEVEDFVNDPAPDARERLIDRLLASPHYGERWGRQWLDVAGYADSDGYTENDPVRKYAYKYRDWVIRAWNSDMPFDQFVVEQLAGDELVKPPYANLTAPQQDHLIATGFLRTVPDGTAQGGDPKITRNAVIAETIKVASTSLLGLTVGCAECHNHRYDPIPQSDYYRMRAIFEPALSWKSWRTPAQRLVTLYTDADRTLAASIETEAQAILDERQKKLLAAIEVIFERELAKVPEDQRERVKMARNTKDAERSPEQIALLKEYPSADPKPGQIDLYDPKVTAELKKDLERAGEVRKKKPVEDFLNPLTEIPGQIPETVLFYRGDPDQPKQALLPGELSVLDWLPAFSPASDAVPTSGRRLAYARHLTSGQHPLVSRVFVNRVWAGHFGRGLVVTPGDFGVLGDRPSHPELLDWIASEFVNPGVTPSVSSTEDANAIASNPHRWSIKHLHRLMMNSHIYQQSSLRLPHADAADPDNKWLSRMPVRRLEAEAVRDAILAVNGQLNHKLGGEPVPVMLNEDGQAVVGIENLNGENRPGAVIPLHGEEYRRSVYVQVRRSRLLAVLDAFDLPTLDPNCTSRNSSTVAPQSLMLMNSEFVLTSARQLAERLRDEGNGDSADSVRHAWQMLFARMPTESELRAALQFVEDEQARLTAASEKISDPKQKPDPILWSWATLCQALLGSNEFLYVD